MALRKIGVGAANMEEVANRIVQYFYDHFIDGQTGQPALALVRVFKTHPYKDLEPNLRTLVQHTLPQEPTPTLRCLALLATRGDVPAWNTRQSSQGHQVIPLVSTELVAQSPMISQLVRQLGLDIGAVLEPDPAVVIDLEQRTFNVFHIAEAKGSPYVPAQQEFVIPHGIQAVLGFGGMLPSGNLLATIMFAKTSISRDTADMFKTLALNMKLAVLPFDSKTVFAPVVGAA